MKVVIKEKNMKLVAKPVAKPYRKVTGGKLPRKGVRSITTPKRIVKTKNQKKNQVIAEFVVWPGFGGKAIKKIVRKPKSVRIGDKNKRKVKYIRDTAL